MNKISCLLVDDEELALDVLEHYMESLDDFQVVKRCNNVFEADKYLKDNVVDLIFLDIQMPKLNGMEWIKKLDNKPYVIFCTAFDQFALESYDVNAIDYLLKPFSYERFEKAARKAQEKISSNHQLNALKVEFVNIRSERKIYKIAVNDILFIHSIGNYYKIVTKDKKIMAYGSLSSLEKELSQSNFLRIHRSYLVAVSKIVAISGTFVILPNDKLPVGRKYREIVEKLYEETPTLYTH